MFCFFCFKSMSALFMSRKKNETQRIVERLTYSDNRDITFTFFLFICAIESEEFTDWNIIQPRLSVVLLMKIDFKLSAL